MTAKLAQDVASAQDTTNALKSWIMVALTLVFVTLYGAALAGWLRPLADEKMVTRLEPLIFVIVGYYFGRLPSQQNEGTLKDEITRQIQKADAAQHAKEQAQQSREALEEKMKNAKAALSPSASGLGLKGLAENLDKSGGAIKEEALRQSIVSAFNILSS